MKTLTKSLIVAALAASTVSQAGVVSFNGQLNQVGNQPTTGYSGNFNGSYDPSLNLISVTAAAVAVRVDANPVAPAPLTGGTLTDANGYSANFTLTPGTIQNTPNTIVIPALVGPPAVPSFTVSFYVNGQPFAATLSGVTAAAGNPTTPTLYTITLNNANGAALTGSFTAVPEPEVYAGVAALGLAGFALWRRRNA